jgi:hypothetical protein
VTGTCNLDTAVVINDSGADKDFRVEGDTNANLLFVDASADSVGIGTNTPTSSSGFTALTINNATNGGQLRLENNGSLAYSMAVDAGNVYIEAGSTRPFRFFNNSVETMRLDASGNLGLGVTPSAWGSGWGAFQIKSGGVSLWSDGSSRFFLSANVYYDGADRKYQINGEATEYVQAGGAHAWFIAPSGSANGTITFTQVMGLSSTGLSVGGTDHGFSSASGSCTVGITAQNASGANAVLNFTCPGSNAGQISYVRNNDRFEVIAGGSGGVFLAQAGTAWQSLSDERKKADLLPIENAAEKVGQLRAVTGRYIWDDESTRRSFLIAQDVQSVLPEAVSVAKEDGDLGLAYTDVIPLLVAAIKEQQAMIDELKAEVAALKGT